jgi:hypothetical protein
MPNDVYWAKSENQILLPTQPPIPLRRADWPCLAGAVVACSVIFVIDLVTPGIVFGLLYNLAVVGVGRAGHAWWPVLICGLGTLFHAVAGLYDLPIESLSLVLANRALAIAVLWAFGGWLAVNLARLASRPAGTWRAVTLD